MKPKRYRAKFIEPGIISYEDVGLGKVFVGKPALDQMNRTFIGAPVVNREHKDLTAEEAFDRRNDDPESWADGIISDVGYDEGWYWADMLIWDEETQSCIDNGYSVSCAYLPTDVGPPGKYHGIDYNEEVLDGRYTHMAIVPNPRYEDSRIFENARKETRIMKNIFKLLSSSKESPATPDDSKVKEIPLENAIFEDESGEQIPVAELIAARREQLKNAKQKLNMEDEVEVDGELVSMKELYDAYKGKRNAEADPDEEKENAEPPTDEVAEPVVKENSKGAPNDNFRKLENAAGGTADEGRPDIETRTDRLKRGRERYGIPVRVGKEK